MRPISFENLRRLVGGGRKKKEKESSFKRSDSFKRISIRRSYLDRGKKKHLQKLEVATQTVAEEEEVKVQEKVDSSVQVEINKEVPACKESREGPGQSVIAYGQWLKGIRKDDVSNTSGIKGAERTVIYVPASDEIKIAPPVIRQLSSSPVFRKKIPPVSTNKPSPTLIRKESNDSAVEMFPWGDSVDVKKSPLIRRRVSRAVSPPLMPDSGTEELCSLSISLGRIWMDAPQVMAPRSLEMPRVAPHSIPAHNSLDSALKDLRDDPIVINRLQKRPTPPVGRTLSSSTASTGLFSSKDSGFSFSISIPKLTDDTSTTKGGFFRKKRPKPKLSVSREGYFKRTSGALVDVKRNSVKRRSSKKKSRNSTRKKNKNNSAKNEMYQVVVNRPPRCLKSLKLDPMIFVPPEKRKASSVKRKQSFKVSVQEIRNFNPHDPAMYASKYLDSDEGLYESLDDLSDEQLPLSGRISRISLRDDEDDDADFPGNHAQLSEGSFASDDDSSSSKCPSPYVPPGVSPVPRRRPVRRRKSGLSHKKSITYVVKPNIMRAPSTLRRPAKKNGKM